MNEATRSAGRRREVHGQQLGLLNWDLHLMCCQIRGIVRQDLLLKVDRDENSEIAVLARVVGRIARPLPYKPLEVACIDRCDNVMITITGRELTDHARLPCTRAELNRTKHPFTRERFHSYARRVTDGVEVLTL
jgi:hypothetical protein